MAFNPSTQLTTKSSNIGELLSSSYFLIPPNQREYRWGKEQREKLWEDLILTVKNDFGESGSSALGHFLGAIVVIGKEQQHDEDRLDIIDGQQRLTTITILLNCLFTYLDVIQDKKIRGKLHHVLTSSICSPIAGFAPRIRLNRENDFYEKSLIDNTTREEKQAYWDHNFNKKSEVQVNIKEAFEYFFQKIDEYLSEDEEKKQEQLRDLAEALTENFYLLVVRTESLWLAYRLFETLNERGLDLSQADLIRNVLLEHAREEGDKSVQKVSLLWSTLTDNYEAQAEKKLELPQIIQFSYTYRHSMVKKESIFDKISGDLRRGHVAALEFANQFKKDSEAWSAFLLGDLRNWTEQLADSQFAITDPLWKSHCSPFIFSAMDMFRDSVSDLEFCFKLAESFLFREGLVGKQSVSNLQAFFGEAASLVRDGVELDSISQFFKNNSPDTIFVENFKVFEVRNMKQGFYALWKMEKLFPSELQFKPKNQSAAQHLEHILPRKPGSEWGDIQDHEAFQAYLSRLGNFLVLGSSINQHIRNQGIEYKMRNDSGLDYENSKLKLPQEFCEKFDEWAEDGQWTFASIARRQEFLAENYALRAWPLD